MSISPLKSLPPISSTTPSASSLTVPSRRLIVVSNRIPVKIRKGSDGDFSFSMSSGGLVAALKGLKMQFIWIGWAGGNFPGDEEVLRSQLMTEQNCVPVFIDDETMDGYYNGFSNSVLWPLFHYKEDLDFSEKLFDAYARANEAFADVISQVYMPGDLIWVHDYHLMLLPKYLRERIEDCIIGFFLHIPFPSSEIYRVLPVREKLLEGVLHSDLIGFHAYDYCRHFLHSCTRSLGLETAALSVSYNRRSVNNAVFPIGIDCDLWKEMCAKEGVKARAKELRESFEGRKMIIGVDRLDYIKGLPQKLEALERLFEKHPEWIGQVHLLQIAVPSREDVEEYQKLRREVETLVGHINMTYGEIGSTPVHYLYKPVPMEELCAMYSAADVCCVTSLRDGMNLVCQEFIVCQEENKGVLVLSEFAGAARCLGASLRVNPWNIEEVSDALDRALRMVPVERAKRHTEMYNYIVKHDANHWGQTFVESLVHVSKLVGMQVKTPPANRALATDFATPGRKILVLGVDGVLIPNVSATEIQGPSAEVKAVLRQLACNPDLTIILHSSRSLEQMEQWFGSMNIYLSAEYGFWSRSPAAEDWECAQALMRVDLCWREEVLQVLSYYCDRTPGSFVDTSPTDSVVTWDYRTADKLLGPQQAQELQLHMQHTNYNSIIDVTSNKDRKMIQVRPRAMTLQFLVKVVLESLQVNTDALMYIGNEPLTADLLRPILTNESYLPKKIVTVEVGTSAANPNRSFRSDFYVRDDIQVVQLLKACRRAHSSLSAFAERSFAPPPRSSSFASIDTNLSVLAGTPQLGHPGPFGHHKGVPYGTQTPNSEGSLQHSFPSCDDTEVMDQ